MIAGERNDMIGSSTRISGAEHEFLCDSGDRLYEIVRAEEETSGPLRVAAPTARSAGLFPIRLSSYLCHTSAYEAPSVKTLPSSQYQTVSVIEPAPRGAPQIEVSFNIDANGILHVSAKDTKTGKQQQVEIKAGSGLSEDEISQMVEDAEKHRDEGRKFQELVGTRNQTDALIYTVRNTIKEHGSKVDGSVIGEVEAALADLEAAMKGDGKAQIQGKTQSLERIAQPLLDAASNGHAQQAGGGSEAEHAPDVVDAEFTEVKGDKE